MCQNDPNSRTANQGNPSQAPGRDDPSRTKQQGMQGQGNVPGRDEDEDGNLSGNTGPGGQMGNKPGQNPRGQQGSQQRSQTGGGNEDIDDNDTH